MKNYTGIDNYWGKLPLTHGQNYIGVVEIPRGSNAKYEYNVEWGVFELDRCLVSAMNYPINYGFMPKTIAEDGDPLDCLIFTDVPLQSGTVVKSKPIAVLKMIDKGHRDDKILLLPSFNNRYKNYKEIRREYLEVYEDFFRNYKNLTSEGVDIIGWGDENEAYNIIATANDRYMKCHMII